MGSMDYKIAVSMIYNPIVFLVKAVHMSNSFI